METKPIRRSRGERRQFWQTHLRAWSKEGGTLKAYAEAHSVCVKSLYRARSRLERELPSRAGARDSRTPTFLPVRVRACTGAPNEGMMVRVRLRNGVTLEIPAGMDGASCESLLEVAGRLP